MLLSHTLLTTLAETLAEQQLLPDLDLAKQKGPVLSFNAKSAADPHSPMKSFAAIAILAAALVASVVASSAQFSSSHVADLGKDFDEKASF